MPILPDPNSQQRVNANPSTGVASYAAGQAENAMAQFGHDVVQLAQQQQEHFDTINAQNAVNKLEQKSLEIMMAPDNGLLTKKGAAAVGADGNPPLLDTGRQQLAQAIDEGGKGLYGNALRLYQQHAQQINLRDQSRLLSHVMQQADVYHTGVNTERIGIAANAAAMDTNPENVGEQVAKAGEAAAANHDITTGGGDAPGRELARRAGSSIVATAAIEQAVASNDVITAAGLLKIHTDENNLTPEALHHLTALVNSGVSKQAGIASAVQGIGLLKANTPVGAPMHTLNDYTQAALAPLGDNPNPLIRETALAEAHRQFAADKEAVAQGREDAVRGAQQWLAQNQGAWSRMPANLYQAVLQKAPEHLDDLKNQYAKAFMPGENIVTNMDAFNKALLHPEWLAKLSEAEFAQFQQTKFSRVDQEKVAHMRYAALHPGEVKNTALDIDHASFSDAVNNRLKDVGINPQATMEKDEKTAQQVSRIQNFLLQAVYDRQAQLGRKLQPKEITELMNQKFAQPTTIPGWSIGNFSITAPTVKPLLSVARPKDIPNTELDQIRSALSSRGVASPTDEQIMNVYWKAKSNAK